MPVLVGDIVWFNSGQGPYTVIAQGGNPVNVTLSQGAANSLQTVPEVCVTKRNPLPKLEFERQRIVEELNATLPSTTPPVTPPST